MGQRAIGLVEQQNGNYNAFYIHWVPVNDFDQDELTKKNLIGDKEPVVKNIEKSDAVKIASEYGTELIFIIYNNENFEIMD